MAWISATDYGVNEGEVEGVFFVVRDQSAIASPGISTLERENRCFKDS